MPDTLLNTFLSCFSRRFLIEKDSFILICHLPFIRLTYLPQSTIWEVLKRAYEFYYSKLCLPVFLFVVVVVVVVVVVFFCSFFCYT